jgi:hypothetical protein
MMMQSLQKMKRSCVMTLDIFGKGLGLEQQLILVDAIAASISLKGTRTSWKLYCRFPKTGRQYL